jgi:hypothetical protein
MRRKNTAKKQKKKDGRDKKKYDQKQKPQGN